MMPNRRERESRQLADLKKRIQVIFSGRIAGELNYARKLALAAAGVAGLVVPAVVGLVNVQAIHARLRLGLAQSLAAATPKFEVASIKPCKALRKGAAGNFSPDRFFSGCTTVQRMIQAAYGLYANGRENRFASVEITGGPAWIDSALFEIEAKAEEPESRAMMSGPMFQALLEDRFKLKGPS